MLQSVTEKTMILNSYILSFWIFGSQNSIISASNQNLHQCLRRPSKSQHHPKHEYYATRHDQLGHHLFMDVKKGYENKSSLQRKAQLQH